MENKSTDISPKRAWPAHPPHVDVHNRPTILFVTMNVQRNKPLMDNESAHAAFREVWKSANQWVVGYYLIMPDHVHLFCSPGTLHLCSIDNWTRFCKRQLSKSCPEICGQWQNDCWDTQIRDGGHYQRKLEYVHQNPVRRGLVETPDQGPF